MQGYGGGGMGMGMGMGMGGNNGMNNNNYLQNQRTGVPGGAGGYGMGPQQTGWGGGMNMQPTGAMGMGMQPTGATGMGMQSTGMGGMGGGMMGGSQTGGGLSAQRTGFPGASGGGFGTPQMGSNPTGGMSGGHSNNYSFLNAPPSSNQFNPSSGMSPQPTGFSSSGMRPQQTGFAGLQAQPTGMPHDPRLQMMSASFMPGNLSAPFGSNGTPSFASPLSQPLPQTFQSLLSNPQVATPKVPWTLSRQEKKDYDQIFRAWTGGEGGGYIEGSMATEVFGQSGLGREDLMKIWNLADINNRGKLNVPEFHVAMGLIYRALNGNPIPDELPAEMIPPSMRDIDSTVDFVKDLIKNDSSSRASPSIDLPGTYSNQRNKKPNDVSVYKHDDSRASGYKSSARHLDRKQVRYEGEDKGDELDSIRRDLENSSKVLDKSAADFAQRTEEDERLEQELDDLKYRVRRVKDDIEYVSRGKRTDDKDEERRKLERELLYLMHDRLPEVEKKIEAREEEKRRETRDGIRARDKRNESYGRYREHDHNRDRDYDRSDNYSRRDRYDDDHYRRRDRDDSRERYSSRRPISPPLRERTPPPPPEAPRKDPVAAPPPAPPAPTSTKSSAAATKNMSAEERSAFIRQQAQERLAARMRALGMAPPEDSGSDNKVDSSVEERLAREKQEAEEKARQAEKQQEEREAARKARLEQAGGGSESRPPAPPAPIKSAMKKAAPPPPKPRSTPSAASIPRKAATSVPEPASEPKEDPEEAALRAREEAHKKSMEERKARLLKMEQEEEEARKMEEQMEERRRRMQEASSPVPTPPAVTSPPPAPSNVTSPPASTTPAASGGSHNPFHRLHGGTPSVTSPSQGAPTAATPSSSGGGGFNPFFRPPPGGGSGVSTPKVTEPTPVAAEDDAAPPPPPPPPPAPEPSTNAPFSIPAPPRTAARPPVDEDEWDVIDEKDNDSDSSDDDDYAGTRKEREMIARSLFGGAGPREPSKPSAPAPEKAAALSKLGGGNPAERGNLLSAIKMGTGLKKTVTNDRSASQLSGKVVGDAAPPAHISDVPREYTPPPMRAEVASPQPMMSSVEQPEPIQTNGDKASHRQSVDWMTGLAADGGRQPVSGGPSPMPAVTEDDETAIEPVMTNTVTHSDVDDGLSEFDMTKTLRVRSLFPYEGQRDVDLSFKENIVLEAHPSKDTSSPWSYGKTQDGKSGWFPSNYAEEIKTQEARALFPYTGNTDEELPFEEGDLLKIVDSSEPDWWKAEQNGMIFIVPAAYMELLDSAPSLDPAASVLSPTETDALANATIPPVTPSLTAESLAQVTSGNQTPDLVEEDGYSSSEDSFLSYFDDEDDEDQPSSPIDADAREAREQRERAREAILEAAGLKVRRPPPGVPGPRKIKRPAPRRPPPSVPVPVGRDPIERKQDFKTAHLSPPPESATIPSATTTATPPTVSVQPDAYDRYEAYLQSKARSPQSRARTLSDAVTPPVPAAPPSPAPIKAGTSSATTTSTGGSSTFKDSVIGGFVSRIGVTTGSSGPEKKSTSAISGPVTVKRLDEPESTDVNSGSATWSSLVDPELLQNITPQERKHQETMFEFIATEGAYVRDLQLAVELFYTPLLQKLDEETLSAIFSNIEDILLFNTTLLSSLEERQKACRLYIDQIGDIFAAQLPNVSVYKPYCINQAQGIRVLQQTREEKPEIGSLLQSIRTENASVRGLDLSSFLLEPMQRLTRYPLLLRQILNYTENMHDQEQVAKALEAVEEVLSGVNESVRIQETHERLRFLSEELWIGQGRLDLTAPTAFMGERKLIKEGEATKAKSGRKLHVVLCNDILVLIEDRSLYRIPFPLQDITAKSGSRLDNTNFTIRKDFRETRKEDAVALKATSPKEAQNWIAAINQAKEVAMRARVQSRSRDQRNVGIGY